MTYGTDVYYNVKLTSTTTKKMKELKNYFRKLATKLMVDTKQVCCGETTANFTIPDSTHYGLVNPNKPGKVRRISNVAAKSNSVCLNDKLLRGPDLLGSLLGILLRGREKPVLLMADIKGMFMHVGVRAQDRRYLRFLWTNNEFEEQEVCEYQRHVFGEKDSPTCAIYAPQQTARDNKIEFPAASEAVFEDFYMDDFIKSLNDVEQVLTMQRSMKQLLLKGSFNLTKWCSNEITFCQKLPQDRFSKTD